MAEDLWNQLASRASLTLTDRQHEQLNRYLELLALANQRMNLTRIIDRNHAVVAHVGDALTLLPYIPAETARLADVGSGGGVPGIPLAIALPQVAITLVEATQKKATFLRETAQTLGLGNLSVVPLRAEEAGQGKLRETFDVVTARAVGELVFLVEWCLPLVKKGGKLLAMKGARAAEEMVAAEKAIHLLSSAPPIVHRVELPGAENHVILEIAKIGRTDPRFPRSASIAKGKALGGR